MRAVYENRIVLGLPIGAPLFRQALRSEARKGLIKLKTVSELEIAPPPAQAARGMRRRVG